MVDEKPRPTPHSWTCVRCGGHGLSWENEENGEVSVSTHELGCPEPELYTHDVDCPACPENKHSESW